MRLRSLREFPVLLTPCGQLRHSAFGRKQVQQTPDCSNQPALFAHFLFKLYRYPHVMAT
ncbi:hypothetical protein GCM10010971_23770 [Silvimonas amylolytica]|uniref:Uncharacterized protein n=1 Tax=Silvimonas amylolytica TaxID=449663 RepID=A0ABQ2PMK7_9NEIS|nr:hypothetical protein GCM10010971_23770 [Silvimonas amylolytica]